MAKTSFGPFKRYDESPIWEIHRNYFLDTGIEAWSTGEIPYSGISNYHEAYKKAYFLISNLKSRTNTSSIKILEIGAGYGEFAKNFLEAFRDICETEQLDYFQKLEYWISDFSQKTIDELISSARLSSFAEQVRFKVYNAIDKYSWQEAKNSFDAIFANYLLDQFATRVIAHDQGQYYEKYISIEDTEKYLKQKPKRKFWIFRNRWIKKLAKRFKFEEIDLEKEISLNHREILETCFRKDKASTVVYSYGALTVVQNFMQMLKQDGMIICSDFNASTKPGIDNFEPCYYGNSLAQPVNFEFIFKYFLPKDSLKSMEKLKHKVISQGGNELGHQQVLIYEDPIKPLHTLILTRADFPYALELGEIYEKVYQQNWFLRSLYRYLVELLLSYVLFIIIAFLAFFFYTAQ